MRLEAILELSYISLPRRSVFDPTAKGCPALRDPVVQDCRCRGLGRRRTLHELPDGLTRLGPSYACWRCVDKSMGGPHAQLSQRHGQRSHGKCSIDHVGLMNSLLTSSLIRISSLQTVSSTSHQWLGLSIRSRSIDQGLLERTRLPLQSLAMLTLFNRTKRDFLPQHPQRRTQLGCLKPK